jgi:hypothetical protein
LQGRSTSFSAEKEAKDVCQAAPQMFQTSKIKVFAPAFFKKLALLT